MNAPFDHAADAEESTETLGALLIRGAIISVLCAATILCLVVGVMGTAGWLG